MKKCMFKGMALLTMGFAFVACSHEGATYDENYASKEKVAQYEQAFITEFGSIASGHDWGFGRTQGARTRGEAVVSTSECWDIPSNFLNPAQNKEGHYANEIKNAANKDKITESIDIDFNNYLLQHVEKPNKNKKSFGQLQAYSSKSGWINVSNFSDGQNNNPKFLVGGLNKALKGTTLMKDMGGAPTSDGKLFRFGSEGNWSYNYKFFTYNGETFLCLNYGDNWWFIKIASVQKTTDVVAEGRIFCEDMGANDFDFNDVVFDVVFKKDKTIEIEILAHGGKLSISVADTPVTLGEMTNTGLKKVDSQKFTIQPVDGDYKYPNVLSIPVVVDPNGTAKAMELNGKPGTIPQKICTFRGTPWPDEYVNIKKVYPDFASWVNAQNPKEWEHLIVGRLADFDMSNNADDYVEPADNDD